MLWFFDNRVRSAIQDSLRNNLHAEIAMYLCRLPGLQRHWALPYRLCEETAHAMLLAGRTPRKGFRACIFHELLSLFRGVTQELMNDHFPQKHPDWNVTDGCSWLVCRCSPSPSIGTNPLRVRLQRAQDYLSRIQHPPAGSPTHKLLFRRLGPTTSESKPRG